MATKDSSALDDELVSDGNTTFAGGQVSATVPESLPVDAFAEAQNMDFDNFGRLRTRRGARTTVGNVLGTYWEDITDTWNGSTAYWGTSLGSQQIRGACFFDTGTTEYVVLEQNNVLLFGSESSTYGTIAGSAIDATAKRPYFAQLGTRLYYCDGVGALRYIDSSVAHQTVTAGKVTSIKITGEGSGYNSAPAITFTHNGGASGAATALLGYGGRVIGATITNAGSGYSATTPPTIAFAAGTTTATGIVNISQLPSKPQLLASHTGRLFAATADTGIAPDTLYCSDILDGESWDLAGASRRVGGDGDPITALFPWYDNYLLVFKERSVWRINCDPLVNVANWEVKLINANVGCVSHATVCAVGGDVLFLSQNGVRTVRQIESGSQTVVGLPMSADVGNALDGVNRSYLYKAAAVFHNNRYFLSFPNGASTYNDRTIVFNALVGKWSGTWTNWAPQAWCITHFSGKRRLNFGDYSGRFWTWDDFTSDADDNSSLYRDDATDYESYLVTRGYNCGEPLVEKQGYTAAVMLENRLDDNVTSYIAYDKDGTGTFTTLDSAAVLTAATRGIRKQFNLLSAGKWSFVQIKVGATRSKLAVNGVAVAAFADTLNPETA